MEKLQCAVQNYDWGKSSAESIITRLKFANADKQKYAEVCYRNKTFHINSELLALDGHTSEWSVENRR